METIIDSLAMMMMYFSVLREAHVFFLASREPNHFCTWG